MMNRVSCFVSLTLACICLGFASEAKAQLRNEFKKAPAMYGSAESPKTVNSGVAVAYVVTVTDRDTIEVWNGSVFVGQSVEADTSKNAVAVAIRSMSYYGFTFRGNSGPGGEVNTYDVAGTAKTVTVDTTFYDDWKGVDAAPTYAIDDDTSIFTQTVNVKKV